MSADVNYDVKTGRLTKDVEVKTINSSFLVAGSIAVNRSYKKGEQWVEEASYFNFKLWCKSQKQVDFYTQYLKKGAQITIDGEMIQERWEKDGQKQSTYVIMANRIIPFFGSGNSSSSGNSNSNGSSVPSFDAKEGYPSDIPY